MKINTETVIYKNVAGCDLKADVHVPADVKPGPVNPALVFLHGGCLMYGSRHALDQHQLAAYLRVGFVVVAIDYRLAPETLLPGIIEDLCDGFAWLSVAGPERFGIDPRRVATVGHSAGGYLALMSGCRTAPAPRAIVSYYGYGDVVGDWYGKPDPFYCSQPLVARAESGIDESGPVISESYEGRGKERLYLYCRQQGLWPSVVGGRDPREDPAFFLPYCPVHNVTPAYPPTMLLHGDRDTDVPWELSASFSDALDRQGVLHRLVRLRGRGHGFDREIDDPVVRKAFDEAVAFLVENTRPEG